MTLNLPTITGRADEFYLFKMFEISQMFFSQLQSDCSIKAFNITPTLNEKTDFVKSLGSQHFWDMIPFRYCLLFKIKNARKYKRTQR